MAPKKNKGKEKVHEPIVESLEHIDFHSSSFLLSQMGMCIP